MRGEEAYCISVLGTETLTPEAGRVLRVPKIVPVNHVSGGTSSDTVDCASWGPSGVDTATGEPVPVSVPMESQCPVDCRSRGGS